MAFKIVEHTYGPHIHMQIQLDNGRKEAIDVYIRDGGETYRTSGDYDFELREEIIRAFNELY